MRSYIAMFLLALLAFAATGCQPLPEVSISGTGTGTGSGTADDDRPSDPSATSIGVSGADNTGDELGCGNGIVEAGESCDAQGESPTCDADCTSVECGDLTINTLAGEECEGEDFGGETCMSQGFDIGTLVCDNCILDTSDCVFLPILELSFSPVKRFDFSWAGVAGADYYQLLESPSPGEPFVPLGDNILGQSISIEMPLHFRYEASYILRACDDVGCMDSPVVSVTGSLAEAVGYIKASNTDEDDHFGVSVALSDDGNTLAVGALDEQSGATGINGDQADDSASASGAVYVFVRDGMGEWSQQAYIKASNTGLVDYFGSVALSGDGNSLAVGARYEDSDATGIGGDQTNDLGSSSGAVYVFVRDGMGEWSQQAYIKASNTGLFGDHFGRRVRLNGDGNTLAVSAWGEDSDATGIDGDQTNNLSPDSGAVYVFVRDGMGAWSQQAYVKAANNDASDRFGSGLALSGDGDTLAVGAFLESSDATGVGGDEADNSALYAGAAYVFVRDGMGEWTQQAYVKASNTAWRDFFGLTLALSGDGNTLAVSAHEEDSNAVGVNGDQSNNSVFDSGAVYVFVRDGMGEWSQQAYIKASNPGVFDRFSQSITLSVDGNTLAIGANQERSNAVGIDGDQANDIADQAGAVYVFVRDGMSEWSQQAYIKASNTGIGDVFGKGDHFGVTAALSGDGNTLAVGAHREASNATGIGGEQANDLAEKSGAVYLY